MTQQSIVPRRSLDPMVVSQHEVLHVKDCDSVREQVVGLKQHWKMRGKGGHFFTLGAASYLDAVDRNKGYRIDASEINRVVLAHFGWLYERIRRGFERLLEQSVAYDMELALPGFHVFIFDGADQSNDRPSTRAHFDMQWMHAMPGHRPEETLSFTLPIEEPSGGCSLEIWPIHRDAIEAGFDALRFAADRPSQTLRYVPGHMLVHDGLLLHAIGRASVTNPQGYRITFQGHGAKVFGQWKLYW
jgi:hypothetical protein